MTAPDVELSGDPGRLDLDAVHAFLSLHAYWARADGVRRVMLATAGAQGLYRRHGFGEPRAGVVVELTG